MLRQPICFMVTAFLVTCGLQAQVATPQPSTLLRDSRVTPVAGESWLIHLNRYLGDTSMGKTWRLGPGPQEEVSLRQTLPARMLSPKDGVTLRGSDLYRLNCRGCHGEAGLGAPPEINSIINPVRATSVRLIQERMKNSGMEMSYADVAKLARQARTALLERLHKGGENMPSFPQLNEKEIRSLFAYLEQLADVPGAAGEQSGVKESHVRVGELIVKSTCHTCHSASGPNPGAQELMEGAIPPLSTLTVRKKESEFIRKVTQGASVEMGTPSMRYRGRMPVFFYLNDQEAADVYLYLSLYPPSEQASDNSVVVASLAVKPTSRTGTGSPPSASVLKTTGREGRESTAFAGIARVVWPLMAALVIFALVGGLVFTLREFNRLSHLGTGRGARTRDLPAEPGMSGELDAINDATRPMAYRSARRNSQ